MKKRDYLNDKNADGILVKVSPKETICMKYQASFSVKNKKTIINVCRMIKRTVLIHCSLETPQKRLLANSTDQDQTPHSAASDQGLHCLQIVKSFFSRNI